MRLDDLPSHSDAPTEAKGRPVLHSSRYTLLSADVRALHPDAPSPGRIDAEALFGEASTGLDPRLPTLVLFECVLAYIEPQRADWLIRVLGETFNDVHALSYDIALAGHTPVSTTGQPIGPSKFGRVMLQNLEVSATLQISRSPSVSSLTMPLQRSRSDLWTSRNQMRKLSLTGAKAYPTIEDQSSRFVRHWANEQSQVETEGRSLFSIWSALPVEEKQRCVSLFPPTPLPCFIRQHPEELTRPTVCGTNVGFGDRLRIRTNSTRTDCRDWKGSMRSKRSTCFSNTTASFRLEEKCDAHRSQSVMHPPFAATFYDDCARKGGASSLGSHGSG